MIKLLWNTQNLIVPKQINTQNRDFARSQMWGVYHKNSSDRWIYEILNGIQFKKIKSESDIENKDIVIIVDSSVEKKDEFYNRLKLICSKIFLVHLGDETGSFNLTSVYKNCNYVFRTFCSNKYFNNHKISCIPIGYKSGIVNKNFSKKKYKWSFIGTPHKSSRHDLLFQLSSIKPSYSYKTEKFNKKIINAKEMSEVLSLTDFIPCPNGFVHPETYRLYEALECGGIPIVENAYKYYDRLFPNNPFIKINKWIEAKSIIEEWGSEKIKEKSTECLKWWKNYKKELQKFIKDKIYL